MTLVRKKIGSQDKKEIHEDLHTVYSWVKGNLMKFYNENFEQISHGRINIIYR